MRKIETRVAPHVGPHGREQPRLARLGVRPDRDVVGGDEQLARLDDRLERVGELRDDGHLDRGLAVVGAEARGRVGHLGVRGLAHDPRARLCRRFFSGEKCSISSVSRSPTTMSARPARIGATSLRDVGGRVLVVGVGVDDDVGAELQARVEARLEARGQALVVRQADDVVDAVLARDLDRAVGRAVVDDEPFDGVEAVEAARGRSASVAGSVSSSLKQGIWMISFIDGPWECAPWPGRARQAGDSGGRWRTLAVRSILEDRPARNLAGGRAHPSAAPAASPPAHVKRIAHPHGP